MVSAISEFGPEDMYAGGCNYCIPQQVIEEWNRGIGFGSITPYSPHIQRLVDEVAQKIWKSYLDDVRPVEQPWIVVTAGAPGAGKTTVLERDLKEAAEAGQPRPVYVDPDAVFLKEMYAQHDPRDLFSQLNDEDESKTEDKPLTERHIRQMVYNLLRPASNGKTHQMLSNAIKLKLPIYFGSTSTNPRTPGSFQFYKNEGYRIRVPYVIAPDDIRWGSIKRRDGTFVQTTEEDTREKGKLLPQRIHDTFLTFADQIDFWYRDQVDGAAVKVAEWKKLSDSEHQGELTILNTPMYEAMTKVHNASCQSIGNPEVDPVALLWENSVEKVSRIVRLQR
ncbi:MAG: zeta toxin family protein [Waddliaceae bacterium]